MSAKDELTRFRNSTISAKDELTRFLFTYFFNFLSTINMPKTRYLVHIDFHVK